MKFLKHIRWRGVAGVFILGLLLTDGGSIFKLGLTSVIPPGIVTPTSLVITLNEVSLEEAINGAFRYSILDKPISLDVVKNTGQTSNILASGTATRVDHNGIRFVLEGTGTYSGIDPCTGLDATDAVIHLPDVINNQLIERLQVPHPVTGLQSGATGEIDPIKVRSDPVSLRLVFPASNSVGCISDTPPSQAISGADTGLFSPFSVFVDSINDEIVVSNNNSKVNSIAVYNRNDTGDAPPQRMIQGPNSELDTPSGIYVDTINNEIAVANSGNDSVTIYPRTWDPATSDVSPTRVITGAATLIRGPGAVYEFNDEIYVTNGPDDSITVYDRNWSSASPAPKRIIQGPTTGLNTPCGIYVDATEIAVVNNGDNSITFYDQAADSANGDVYPLRTIKGDKTGISNACGLFVDAPHNEVAIANAGGNSINFYNRGSGLQGDENVYPARQINGVNAALSQPVGVFLDTVKDEIAVANLGKSSITIHKRNDATPHLLRHPQFVNPIVQQQLLVSYVYQGTILRSTGQPQPPADPTTGQPYERDPITDEPLTNVDPNTQEHLPIPLPQGYAYVLKVTDSTMHSANDVNTAFLIPPSNMQFHLADGSAVSNLILSCPVFTPFIIDELTTNCLSQPLIISPFPPQPVTFRIAATVISKVQNKTFVPNIAPLRRSELPLVLPRITFGPTGAILDVNWSYVNDSGQPLASAPLITSQSFQITYGKAYSDISACYQKRVKTNLAFSSGSLSPDVRSKSDVKDTGCDIFLKDVSNISFSLSDAYETRYAFSWNVVD